MRLLQRNARGASPTPAGKAFLARARVVQAELRKAGEELEALRESTDVQLQEAQLQKRIKVREAVARWAASLPVGIGSLVPLLFGVCALVLAAGVIATAAMIVLAPVVADRVLGQPEMADLLRLGAVLLLLTRNTDWRLALPLAVLIMALVAIPLAALDMAASQSKMLLRSFYRKAQEAAGEIHSDIARGFIRAEVVAYDALIARGSMAACKEHGEVRLEGKEYVVKDGDIINFRHAT